MKTYLGILLLLCGSAHADKIVSQETKTVPVAKVDVLQPRCRGGVPADGHHFPAPLAMTLEVIGGTLISNSNVTQVKLIDPVSLSCPTVLAQVEAGFPADVKVTRTISEGNRLQAGQCTHILNENVRVELPGGVFEGDLNFMAEPLPADQCAP